MVGRDVRMRGENAWITKSYHEADYPHPVIEHHLVLWSDRPQPVIIVDPLPEYADPDRIAFEPDHRSAWQCESDRLVFKRPVAGNEFTTAYTYRDGFSSHLDEWLSPPTVRVGDEMLEYTEGAAGESIEDGVVEGNQLIDFP